MARKPITTAYMTPGIDRSNMIAIQKRFTSQAWDELVNSGFNVSTSSTPFTLPITWQEVKDNYAEIYFCVRGQSDRQHTIIVPTDMINKEYASSMFNLASGNDASMFVTLGSLSGNNGSITSSVSGSTRLIVLAR